MADHIDAGKLDKPAQVLELKETGAGVWEWTPVRRAWASITFQPKTNLFSKVGIGARDAAVVVRRQPLTLHNALRWGSIHLFLTSIAPMGRNHLDVDAKEELKRALKEYKGTILLICHEPEFYEGLATKVMDCLEWALRV